MLSLLTEPHNLPFSVALFVVALLAVLQLVGIADLLGTDTHLDLDHSPDLDAGLLSLAGMGRVPFMMWLMLLLGLFGLAGLAEQQVIAALAGGPVSAWLAAPGAGLAAFLGTGAIARLLGRIVPRDETSAINVATLVGREAQIVIGTATPGNPARARVTDRFGQAHYVMVEPDNPGQSFAQDETVLLVRREKDLFKAIARGDRFLPRLG